MYVVTGANGQVGGAVIRELLRNGKAVRAIVRDRAKAQRLEAQGCELVQTSFDAVESLVEAFRGTEGVFAMLPPTFDPSPDFIEGRANSQYLFQALQEAKPRKVVALSTIGAQVTRPNLLNNLHIFEETLSALSIPTTYLRPSWFMENFSWDIEPAMHTGVIASYLQPIEREIPMVSTEDVGRTAAELLLSPETLPVVELEGPERVSPLLAAETFSRLLGKSINLEVVPREKWESLFQGQGMKNPLPRMQMLDGFNQGWIDFEGRGIPLRKGRVFLREALFALLQSRGVRV